MALLDEIKKSISEISKNPEIVVKQSEAAMRDQKARAQKRMLEKDLNEQYARIGRLYLAGLGDGEIPESMLPVVDRIRACQEAIEETEQRISGSK